MELGVMIAAVSLAGVALAFFLKERHTRQEVTQAQDETLEAHRQAFNSSTKYVDLVKELIDKVLDLKSQMIDPGLTRQRDWVASRERLEVLRGISERDAERMATSRDNQKPTKGPERVRTGKRRLGPVDMLALGLSTQSRAGVPIQDTTDETTVTKEKA